MSETWKTVARMAGGPIVSLVIDGVEASSKSMDDASRKNLEALREEAAKQQIKMDYSQHQARVAQELAIAKRIENATEVEIEEYYDNSGKGSAGLNVNAETQTGSFGIFGENRRVSKRVYRFTGDSQVPDETYEQESGEIKRANKVLL
jgi:RNA 3'-terminal phosphate cyclase